MEQKQHKATRNARTQKRKSKESDAPKVTNIIKKETEHTEPPKGNPTSVCQVCGKTFDQDYVSARNAYSNFKTCHSCRKTLSNKKEKKIQETEVATVTLPFNPHPWQAQAFEDFKTHRFNLWACGNRCLLENDFIQGCNKLVQDVVPGDFVFSGNGEFQKVTAVGTDEYDGLIYHVKATNCIETVCNEEHPFLVCDIIRDFDNRTGQDKTLVRERFVKAKDIQGEAYTRQKHGPHIRKYLKLPKVKKTLKCGGWKLSNGDILPLDEDFAWVYGLYCAEGCKMAKQSKWALNYYADEVIEKTYTTLQRTGYQVGKSMDKKNGVCRIVISRPHFADRMADEMGLGSTNKHIPDTILFNENEEILVAFLKGYFAGDGWYDKSRQTLTACTVSKRLALDLQTAFIRLGYFLSINYHKREKSKNGDYKVVCTNPDGIRRLGYEANKKHVHSTAIKIGDDFYCPLITDTKPEHRKCKIYYFSTEDGTFLHNNQINHNSGKDFCANMIGIWYFVQCLNENRAINNPEMAPSVLWWIIAPTEPMAKQNWRDLKKQFPKEWIVAISNSTMTMETIGGGIIEVRSAYNPESLVGVGLDLVTITEGARIGDLDIVWANLEARLGSPGRGLAADRKGQKYGQGKAIINSTPIGKNYFYEMFKWGQKGSSEYVSTWVSYQLPWTCNPANEDLAKTIVHRKHGDVTYEEDLRRRLGERLYRQNYLADFLAMDGAVFKDFEEKCVQNIFNMGLGAKGRENYAKEWVQPIPYHSYRIGYDPATGSSADSPAVVVRDMNTNRVVMVVDLYGKNYDQQWDEISYISRHYNYAPCVWLRTGHTAVENQLAKRGVVEIPIDEQGGKKASYIQSLERAIQNKDLHVLLDGTKEVETFVLQMNDYTEKAGKYSNEQQEHDDFVSACYAAWYDYSQEELQIPFCGTIGFVNRNA